jgi:hypothetical protein
MLLNGVFIHEDLLVMVLMFFFLLLSIYFILHKNFIFEHLVAFVDSLVHVDERGGATNNVHASDVVLFDKNVLLVMFLI